MNMFRTEDTPEVAPQAYSPLAWETKQRQAEIEAELGRSAPVDPEHDGLALLPLLDPAQLKQHLVVRRLKTDGAGVKQQIQCREPAHTGGLRHGGEVGTREGFPDPPP